MAERELYGTRVGVEAEINHSGGMSRQRAARRWTANAWRITALLLILLFLIPIVRLFTRITPQALWENLASETVRQAIGISLRTTLTSLALILLLGTPLAYLMGRHQFQHKRQWTR